jgi:hypothetical protein
MQPSADFIRIAGGSMSPSCSIASARMQPILLARRVGAGVASFRI